MKCKILSLFLALTMVAGMAAPVMAADGDTVITILGTSDTHGSVWGWAYEFEEESTGCLAQISTYVKEVRAESDNVILVDDGDTIQGTIMTDDLCNLNPDDPHPVFAAMNYMKYDAMGLGNHEFNWGITSQKKLLSQAEFPVICSNVKEPDGSYLARDGGWTIVERGGVKVAIIAAVTPNIQRWDGGKDGINDLKVSSLADGVDAAIKEIGDKADVFFVMAHAGFEQEYSEADAAKTILERCPQVSALQVGHTHTVYTNNDDPAVAIGGTRNGGRQVVRFDLTVGKDKKVTAAKVEVVDVTDREFDPGIRGLETVKTMHEKAVDFVGGTVLGHATAKFQPVDEIRGVPSGRYMDTAVIDFMNTVQLEYSGADVTTGALLRDTSDLPEGPLNYGNIFDIYHFVNMLELVTVTGAELKAYMEYSASYFNQWKPGDINVSFNPDLYFDGHDHFSGVNYEVNLSKPVGERIENVTFKGEPVTDDQTFKLAINDYQLQVMQNLNIISGKSEWEAPQSIRDMLKDYITKHDPIDPADFLDNNWKVTGIDLQLDNPERARYIELVNNGTLPKPYGKSINLYEANNVIFNDVLQSADAIALDGVTYYRLRDLAVLFAGTTAQFNIGWDGKVVFDKGAAYTAEALAPAGEKTGTVVELILSTGEGNVTVPAALVVEKGNINGSYYVSAQTLNSLLGTVANDSSGYLTLNADKLTAQNKGG